MIAGIFYDGSGLGDQLFRYITVRTLAEKKGFDWQMFHSPGGNQFKGDFFTSFEMGSKNLVFGSHVKRWEEKCVRDDQGTDIRSYDPEINFVESGTIIDGSFEDDKYWRSNLDNISKWLAVEPLEVAEDLCMIGFRGGEYASQPDLFLTKDYWEAAIAHLPQCQFEVHTDDPALAKQFFPDFPVLENQPISHSKHTNMGINWRTARYAKYAIIPNSAFFILPRILKHHEDPTAITIAPRYWARRNTKTWARPACYYPEFRYI